MSSNKLIYRQLGNQKEFNILADALGETPETIIPAHCLRRELCKAFVAGEIRHFKGAIVQEDSLRSEPIAFGTDAEVLWNLLKMVKGWDCLDVDPRSASDLGELIKREMNVNIQYYNDIYFTLTQPVVNFRDDDVRLLTPNDLELLESAPKELQGYGFEDARIMLTDGVTATAIKDNKIVAIAYVSALSEHYTDIGVFTEKKWRKYGIATAAASLVAKKVQDLEKIPVWSTGENNIASVRIAQKLGFKEVSRMTFIIVEKEKN